MPARVETLPAGLAGSHPSNKRPAHKPGALAAARAARPAVLHLAPALMPDDPGRETVDLAILAQRAGWRAIIASNGGLLVPEAERTGVRHARLPLDRNGLLVNWRNRVPLEALIQKERPALIHAHGPVPALHALGPCRAHHLPLLADFTQPLPDRPFTHRLMKKLGALRAVLRVPSDFMARHLADSFHVEPDSLYVVPPGLDLKAHDSNAISLERLAALGKLWRLPEQAAVILMPMPLAEQSGHRPFLEALAALKREDVFAVLIGNDRAAPGLRGEIESLIERLGLAGKVIMPEHCLDWPAAGWLASLVVAPNAAPRGQALELLSAQALGRAVIVSNAGANPEMVLAGETALIVPPGDVKALTEALRRALALNQRQRLDLVFRARDFVTSAFPQENWAAAMLQIYEALRAPAKRAVKAA
ncbi:MAG TPA: glycosyltransferase [Alphaproteobacteria bacterium]|nr:glycosyltransferase [Alphaproteobacteria bacterium]